MLTKDEIRKYWSQTYNKDGKPDWSHIFPFYDETIVFQDSIQTIKGFKDFEKMCMRLTKRSKSLHMEIVTIMQEDQIVLMEWIMTIAFRRAPSSHMYGASKLTFNEEGKIIHQRDYYDLWGDIYDNIPGWRRFYRWFMRKVFG